MYLLTFYLFMVVSLFYFMISFYMLLYNYFFFIEVFLNSTFYVLDMNFYILMDSISCLFMFIVYFISSMVIYYSIEYMREDVLKLKFLYLVILFVISMNFMVLCPNMLVILLGWDGLGLVSYCLVIFYNNESSSSAGMITVMTNRLGDIGLILSIILMMNLGFWNFNILNYEEGLLMNILCLMIMLGSMTKSAQMPFSSWLPAAMAAPTPVSALVHSSTLVTAGVYLILRLNCYFLNGEFSKMLMVVSTLTMFLSGLGALYEVDLKKIIALSTLSQLGVMMMILSVGSTDLAFFHLLSHAVFKAMLFMAAGVVIHSMSGWQDIRKLNLFLMISPNLSMVIIIGSFSLLGFPFLSGFYSKDLVLEMMYFLNNSILLLVMILLSTMFTIIYSLRLMFYLFLKMNFINLINFYESKEMMMPIYFMSLISIILGCSFNWCYFMNPMFIYLNFKVKLINLILILLGSYLFLSDIGESSSLEYSSNSDWFFVEMWFLKSISSGGLFFFLGKMKYYMKNSEMWMENISAQGVSSEIESIMLNVLMMNFKGLKYFSMWLVIFSFMIFML